MHCVQPVLPILGLRPIGLVYCNPSLLGYIMKVTPPIRVCGVSLHRESVITEHYTFC
jgi:hypothetical protein